MSISNNSPEYKKTISELHNLHTAFIKYSHTHPAICKLWTNMIEYINNNHSNASDITSVINSGNIALTHIINGQRDIPTEKIRALLLYLITS